MKKVLVTGSCGYIGTVLVPYLRGHGYECSGIDAGFFRDCTLTPLVGESTAFKDVGDIKKKDIADADAVVHLAGISNDPMKTLQPNNVYGPARKYTHKLASMCRDLNIKFVFASSCSVYGAASNSICNEESSPNPVTPYALNKLEIESDLAKLSGNGFSPVSLRFATVYGFSPRIRFDIVVNMFVGMALTSGKITLNSRGEAWRPFVHIQDACKAIRFGIDHENEAKPLILNAGDTNENYSILQTAQLVRDAISGSEIEFLSPDGMVKDDLVADRKVLGGVDKRNYKVSFEKIKEAFEGFGCDWNLNEGIKELAGNLMKAGLNKETFKNINFYRLQKMEHLLEKGYLTEDLTWKKPARD